MTPFEDISRELGSAIPWSQQGGVHWLAVDPSQIRMVADAMNRLCARFVTITATELSGEEGLLLEYLWDLNGELLGFRVRLSGKAMGSIFDVCPAVDWIEREVHEGFAIDFAGREYEPLLLRPGDKAGVNLREVPA